MKDHYLLIQLHHFHVIQINRHKHLLNMFIKMLLIQFIIQINMKKLVNLEMEHIHCALK